MEVCVFQGEAVDVVEIDVIIVAIVTIVVVVVDIVIVIHMRPYMYLVCILTK